MNDTIAHLDQENAAENKDKLVKLFDLRIINENREYINNEMN